MATANIRRLEVQIGKEKIVMISRPTSIRALSRQVAIVPKIQIATEYLEQIRKHRCHTRTCSARIQVRWALWSWAIQ